MAVSSPDLKAFLVATPFFGGLPDASLDLLVSMLVERRFDAGATVVAEGEHGALDVHCSLRQAGGEQARGIPGAPFAWRVSSLAIFSAK